MVAELALAISATAVTVARELIALRRYRVRTASIERLAGAATGGLRVVDRGADGSVIDVTVGGDSITCGPRQRRD